LTKIVITAADFSFGKFRMNQGAAVRKNLQSPQVSYIHCLLQLLPSAFLSRPIAYGSKFWV
jgi:hypothetical protein